MLKAACSAQRLADPVILDTCLEIFVPLSARCTEKLGGTLAVTGKELLNPKVGVITPGHLFLKMPDLFSEGRFLIWARLKGALAEGPARKSTTHGNYKHQQEALFPLIELKEEGFAVAFSQENEHKCACWEAEGLQRGKAHKAAVCSPLSEPR